jgi:hypothetical protein
MGGIGDLLVVAGSDSGWAASGPQLGCDLLAPSEVI